MKKIKKIYDKDTNSLMLVLKEGEEDYYEEVAPGINVEFNKEGEPIGIEVQNAYRPYSKKETSELKPNFKTSLVRLENSSSMQSVFPRFYSA